MQEGHGESWWAYSSVSHLGFCTLGIFALSPLGISGSVLQQINHGISTGALFLIVGILYERRHTREISEYGGNFEMMPADLCHHHDDRMFLVAWDCRCSMASSASSRSWEERSLQKDIAVPPGWYPGPAWAVPGSCARGAASICCGSTQKRVFFGPVTNPKNENLHDLTPREVATFVPLLIMAFWILGSTPMPFFQILEQLREPSCGHVQS